MTTNDENILNKIAALNIAINKLGKQEGYEAPIVVLEEMRENLVEFMDDPNSIENWEF